MKKSKVSIIVPVYNSENYVETAILSVLKQDYQNFELLLINDGSLDHSLEILRDYERKDPRIKVFDKPNGGISSTRNFGLSHASGDYIAFLDNDDEYLSSFLSDNIALLEKYHADMIKFNKIKLYVSDSSYQEESKITFPITFLEGEDIWKNFDQVYRFGGTIWNAIYRASFLRENKIMFDESQRHVIEDHRFNLECYRKVSSIVLNPKSYYLWKVRVEHSTTGKFILERFENIKVEANALYLFLQSKNISKFLPHFCAKLKLSYLVNILLVMNYDNSGFSYHKFKKYLKDLKKYEIFSYRGSFADRCYIFHSESFGRFVTYFLFECHAYSILYVLSKMKLRRDIKYHNRRF